MLVMGRGPKNISKCSVAGASPIVSWRMPRRRRGLQTTPRGCLPLSSVGKRVVPPVSAVEDDGGQRLRHRSFPGPLAAEIVRVSPGGHAAQRGIIQHPQPPVECSRSEAASAVDNTRPYRSRFSTVRKINRAPSGGSVSRLGVMSRHGGEVRTHTYLPIHTHTHTHADGGGTRAGPADRSGRRSRLLRLDRPWKGMIPPCSMTTSSSLSTLRCRTELETRIVVQVPCPPPTYTSRTGTDNRTRE